MNPKEILKFCIDKGLLIDGEALKLLSETNDGESVKLIIERLKDSTQKRIITKQFFEQNREKINEFFLDLPKEKQKKLEKLKINLGLQIEISKEVATEIISTKKEEIQLGQKPTEESEINVKVLSEIPSFKKKIVVEDFVTIFRDRFEEMKTLLQEHQELENPISINKLSQRKERASLIGMVLDKRVTKNKNLLLEIEDLTGRTRVLINQNKPELYEIAEDITPDSVVGFTGFGDREIFFASNIVFPDAVILEKKKSPVEECALFIGDLHYGSKLFMEKNFLKFIDYLNGKVSTPKEEKEVKKIKYLFLVGDVVSGIGNYPSQQKDLEIEDIEEQFQGLAGLLGKIRRDIKIIISPGNHDGVRLLEPQPLLDEKYAWPLYNLKNVVLTGNPSCVNIGWKKNFSGFNILTYHGFSYMFYANNIPSLIKKELNAPEQIMKYLLKNRHLAPTHTSTQYFPFEKDMLLIKKVPDIFVSAHTHKCAVSSYNNILLISTATWEEETEYQKRKGNQPDFCKAPMFNLKTREIKILDFE